MNKLFVLLGLAFACSVSARAQALFGEFATGPDTDTLFFSGTLNIEGPMLEKEWLNITARAGIGPVLTTTKKTGIIIPIGVGLNVGEGAHRFEIGANYNIPGGTEQFYGTIGYRYQKFGGVLFRVFYAQYFTAKMLIPYFGISIGKSFY